MAKAKTARKATSRARTTPPDSEPDRQTTETTRPWPADVARGPSDGSPTRLQSWPQWVDPPVKPTAPAARKPVERHPEPEEFRAVCPNNPQHHARVYRTLKNVRYCICDDCGAGDNHFQMDGPPPAREAAGLRPELADYFGEMADYLDGLDHVQGEGGRLVVEVDHRLLCELTGWLREAAAISSP